MRIDSLALSESLQQPAIEPRFFVSVAFDFAQTDVWHFTSHSDVPTPDPAKTIKGVLTGSSGGNSTLKSRDFKSTLGAISFTLLNKSNEVSQLLRNKKTSSKSLARKVVKVYMGCKGFALSDYELRFTQVCKSIEATAGGYRVACDDILRLVKSKVFIMRKTQLVADINAPADAVSPLDIKVLKGWDGRTHTGQSSQKIGYLKIGSGDNEQVVQYTGYRADNNTYLNCKPAFSGVWRSVKAVDENGKSQGVEVEEYQYLEGPAVKVLYALLTGIWLGQSGERLPDNWHCGVALDHISTAQFNGVGDDLFRNGNDNVGPKVRFKGLKSQDAKRLMEKDILPVISCFTPILATGEIGLKRRQPVRAESAYQVLIDNSVINLQQLKSVKINYNEDRIVNQVLVKWAQNGDDFLRANVVVSQDSIDVYGQRDPVVVELRGVFGDQYALDNIYDMLEDYVRMYSSEVITTKLSLLPSMTGIEVGDVVRIKLAYVDDHTGAAEFDHRMRVVGVSFDQFTGRLDVDLEGGAQTYGLDRSGLGHGVDLSFYTRNGTNLEQAFPSAFTRVGNVVTLNQEITLTGADKLYDNPDNGYNDAAVYYLDLGGVGSFNQNAKINIAKNVFLKFSGHWYQNRDVYGVGGGHAGGDARRHNHDIEPSDHKQWSSGNAYFGNDGGILLSYLKRYVEGHVSFIPEYPLPNQGLLGYAAVAQSNVVFFYETYNSTPRAKALRVYNPVYEVNRSSYGPKPLSELPTVSLSREDPSTGRYLCQLPVDLQGGGGVHGGNVWQFQPNSATTFERPSPIPGSSLIDKYRKGSVVALGGTGGRGGAGLVVLHRGHTPSVSAKINLSGGDAASDYQKLSKFPVSEVNYSCDFAAGIGAPGKPGAYYEIVDGAFSESSVLNSVLEQKYGRANPYGDGNYPDQDFYRDSDDSLKKLVYWGLPLSDFPSSRPTSVDTKAVLKYLKTGSVETFRGVVPDGAGVGNIDNNNYVATHAKSIRLTERVPVVLDDTVPAANPLSINAVLQQYDSLAADKVAIEIAVQSPSDDNYAYSIVEIKKQGDWERVGTDPEVSYIAKKDGSDYIVRARSVSKLGVESLSGPQKQVTVPNAAPAALPAATNGSAQVFERGAKLRWDAATDRGLLSAEVYLDVSGAGFSPAPANLVDKPVGQSSTLAGLTPDTNYWAKVRLVDAYGTKSGYITLQFKTLALQVIDGSQQAAPTFYQSAFPSSPKQGWLCYRSDQGNKLYRYNGSAWQAIVDQAITAAQQTADSAAQVAAQALGNAASAQAAADGKIESFYQAAAPTSGMSTGDIWFDTDDGNKVYRYNGSAWQAAQDSKIAQAINSAQTAQTTADGKAKVVYSATAPTVASYSKGDMWVNSGQNNKLNIHSGSAWVLAQDYYSALQAAQVADGKAVQAQQAASAAAQVASQALNNAASAQAAADGKIESFYQASAPTSGMSAGDIWFDTDDGNKVYRYNGSAWQAAQDSKIAQAIDSAQTAKTTADGKAEVVYSSSTPAVASYSAGDMWVNSGQNNKLSIHSGSAWVLAQDYYSALQAAQAADGKASVADGKAQNALDTAIKTYKGTAVPALSLGKQDDIYIQTFTAIVKGQAKEMKSIWQKLLVNGVLAWVVVASTGCSFDEVYGANRPDDNATQGADWNSNLQNIPDTLLYADTDDIYHHITIHRLDDYVQRWGNVGDYTLKVDEGVMITSRVASVNTQEGSVMRMSRRKPFLVIDKSSWDHDFSIVVSFWARITATNGVPFSPDAELFFGRGDWNPSADNSIQNHVGFVMKNNQLFGSVGDAIRGLGETVLIGSAGNTGLIREAVKCRSESGVVRFYIKNRSTLQWDEVGALSSSIGLSSGANKYLSVGLSAKPNASTGALGVSEVSIGEYRYHEKID